MEHHVPMRLALTLSVCALGSSLVGRAARAQGCEPIRFSTPVNLGGEGQAYQRGREWQLTLAYRRLASNEWFIGSEDRSELAPGGQSPVFKVHTLVADVGYSLNERFRLHVSVPVSRASFSRIWPDKVRHEQTATGIGDVSLMGEAWILTPRTHARGNVSVGLGVKAPTGSHTITSRSYSATGSVEFPADQTIQPGDGGWALLSQIQAFRQVTERTYAYAAGSYMASPKAHTNVRLSPTSTVYWAVPDVYSARAGGAVSVLPDYGLSMSLGGRVDGIPVHDLLGGGDDDTIKRTSYVLFADPGLSLARGNGTLTLSMPYRLKVNRQKSLYEQRTNGVNGGGFAKYLLFASYSHRL
jgi:hypothetical protein